MYIWCSLRVSCALTLYICIWWKYVCITYVCIVYYSSGTVCGNNFPQFGDNKEWIWIWIWCITTALYFGVAERTRVRALRRQQRWSRSHGFNRVRADSHTRSVQWPAPLRASALKEQHRWSRLFKDVLSPVRFWVWSFPGASGRSRSLPHVSGIQHTEEAFVDGSCFLWGHYHYGVA